jgi:hypothetical protein
MQYEGAGYEQAREALEGYIALLQKAVATPDYDLVRTAHFDMGLTYTRLALLAEANGKPELAPALIARAVEEARAGGFKNPNPEGLRSFIQRVDRRVSPTPKPGA